MNDGCLYINFMKKILKNKFSVSYFNDLFFYQNGSVSKIVFVVVLNST